MKSDPGTTTPKRQVNLRDLVDTTLLIVVFTLVAVAVLEVATGWPGLLCAFSRYACVMGR